MRSRFSILAAAAAIIGLPMWAIGQPPEAKPAIVHLAAQLAATNDGLWAYELATPADSRLLTWSRFLGADLATADAPLRAQLKLNDGEGYVVTGVKPDGAAAEGGLVIYDVVVGLNDEPKPEATYPLLVWRQGEKKPIAVKLKPERQGWIGVSLAEIDDAMRSQLSLPAGRGLLVQEVTEDSPAKQAGLQKHDVIDGWSDGAPSGTVEEFSKVVRQSAGKALSVQVIRHGKSLTIHFTPQKRAQQAAATSEVGANHLLWLARVQHPVHLRAQMAPLWNLNTATAAQIAATQAAQATGDDRQSMLSRVEKQLDRLLKELQSAQKTIEEIRKLEQREKKSVPEEKK
jgi:membrane-associated protease RseP (regulator of RpoE activity)